MAWRRRTALLVVQHTWIVANSRLLLKYSIGEATDVSSRFPSVLYDVISMCVHSAEKAARSSLPGIGSGLCAASSRTSASRR